MRVRLQLALAVLVASLGVWTLASPSAPAQDDPQAPGEQRPGSAGVEVAGGLAARGRALYLDGCSDCHGPDLRGVPGRGPTLLAAGAASVDFYVSTGRMPLARPGIQPQRADPVYTRDQIDALIAYIAPPAAGGPAIPVVTPELGSLQAGRRLFADKCSGCHQIMTKGGIAPGLVAPSLEQATPGQIGEAIRVGPYLMPLFSTAQLDDADVNSIARYVEEIGTTPPDRGGWGIGNIGPIPEGLAAWLLLGAALLIVARIIGEREAA